MLHEKEVHKTFQCESLKVSYLTLVKEELILQLEEKIKGKDSPGGAKKQNYGFCSETHIRT